VRQSLVQAVSFDAIYQLVPVAAMVAPGEWEWTQPIGIWTFFSICWQVWISQPNGKIIDIGGLRF
jgi:hypothetical protein